MPRSRPEDSGHVSLGTARRGCGLPPGGSTGSPVLQRERSATSVVSQSSRVKWCWSLGATRARLENPSRLPRGPTGAMTSKLSHPQKGSLAVRRDDRAGGARAVPWVVVVFAALVVTCCVAGPPVLLGAAHLTLAAAAGLSVGMLIVIGACWWQAGRGAARRGGAGRHFGVCSRGIVTRSADIRPRSAPASDGMPRDRAQLERQLRRAQATVDGLMHALPALRGQVAALESENDQLQERLSRAQSADAWRGPWHGPRPQAG